MEIKDSRPPRGVNNTSADLNRDISCNLKQKLAMSTPWKSLLMTSGNRRLFSSARLGSQRRAAGMPWLWATAAGFSTLGAYLAVQEWWLDERRALHNFHVSISDDPNHGLHPPHHHWEHHSPLKTFDHQAIRRGFQVYKEGGFRDYFESDVFGLNCVDAVCSACHSLKLIAFRNLVNVSHTEDEARELAESYMIEDGPDDMGEMYHRPGRVGLQWG